MNKAFLLTKDGVAELEQELAALVAERGPVAERIKSARELGDLSENAEYQTAREEHDKLEGRISEIEHILRNAQLITKPRSGAKVQIGSTVKLKGNGKTKEFQVVGTVEADPLNGKISDESPIGQALLGKKLGESVDIVTPAETSTYKITEIN